MAERVDGSGALDAALEGLERAFLRANPEEADRFRPGLSDDGITEVAEQLLPYRLPDDVVHLYRWHDGFSYWREGTDPLGLLMDSELPSLEESIRARQWLMDFAVADGLGLEYWPPAWFPAFGTSAHGELITLEPRESPEAAVVWGYHSHDGEVTGTFDSVLDLVKTTTRLWEEGLLPWVTFGDGAIHQHRKGVIREMNPRCYPDGGRQLRSAFKANRYEQDSWLEEWRASIQ